ncbi:hypothetical protein [Paenibacillus silvisoli]|uniref:hypothetical protein n=1 Tax=Paenibacillus silvisoli TaxID=3110539 RepID=UPI0028040566|nr:hypothetical protein [Paenibacillus silvisoli]
MKGMKRITVEMVKEAYSRTGLKPHQGDFYYLDGLTQCACGLGVLYTAEKGIKDRWCANRSAINKFGEEYATGFVNGFDQEGSKSNEETYLIGYEDGRAAWEAVKEL